MKTRKVKKAIKNAYKKDKVIVLNLKGRYVTFISEYDDIIFHKSSICVYKNIDRDITIQYTDIKKIII